ncbi:MAG: hypothetical protein KGZ37_06765 [Nitrosarchaeum sp.]|nr:hypothetical protein [Nitrosarchaeum sp.]
MKIKQVGFFIILLFIIAIPTVYAQVSIGEEANQKTVNVIINESNQIHVKHEVIAAKSPKQLQLIDGVISNLSVTDIEGDEKQFGTIGDNDGIIVFPSQKNIVVQYDLEDVLTLKNNVWTLDFRYLKTTNFIFPNEVDLVFVNDKPVYLGEKKGIACHGCQMILEYSINEPKILKNIKYKNKDFLIEIRSFAEIDKFNFNQSTKEINFHVNGENQFLTLVIPLQLLPESYDVLVDNERIYFHGYINNGTHVWINVRSDTTGLVSIIDSKNTDQVNPNMQDLSLVSSINQNIIVLLVVLIIVGVIVTIVIMKKKSSVTSKNSEDEYTQNIH